MDGLWRNVWPFVEELSDRLCDPGPQSERRLLPSRPVSGLSWGIFHPLTDAPFVPEVQSHLMSRCDMPMAKVMRFGDGSSDKARLREMATLNQK